MKVSRKKPGHKRQSRFQKNQSPKMQTITESVRDYLSSVSKAFCARSTKEQAGGIATSVRKTHKRRP